MLSVAKSKVVEKTERDDGPAATYRLVLIKCSKNQKTIKAFQKFKLGEASKVPSISEPPQAIVQEFITLDKSNQILWALAKIDPMQRHFPKTMISLKVQAKSR